ncbi:tetratricopeptide repeat protein [Chitinophaga lutea]
MKKRIFTVFALLFAAGGAMAQSVEAGLKNLYYGKYAAAKQEFEKVIASKPSEERAYYYLGMAELGLQNKSGASAAFQKGLQAVPNSPLLTAGQGRIDLMDGNASAARQKFDAANAATKGKNGDVARAIADANTEVKGGDKQFALTTMQTLLNNEGASKRNQYTATAADYIELGDAYRYLGGENGGKAIEAYEKALELENKNAEAVMKQGLVNYNAKLLENTVADFARATQLDPNYAPAFYELYQFYYTPRPRQWDLGKAKQYLQQYLAVADQGDKVTNEYYLASIMFLDKDYDSAIKKAESLLPQANEGYKMKLERLITDAYLQKGDSLNAQRRFDQYVQQVGESKLEPIDYKLGSEVYGRLRSSDSATRAQNSAQALNYLEKFAAADTTKDADTYEAVAKAYQQARAFGKAAEWYQKLSDLKIAKGGKAEPFDLYNVGYNYYLASAGAVTDTNMLAKAAVAFAKLSEVAPDITTGYYWQGMTAAARDVEAKSGVALPYFEKYISMAESDPVKNKAGLIKAYTYIMVYYYNKDDKANMQKYMDKLAPLDPGSEPMKQIKDVMASKK